MYLIGVILFAFNGFPTRRTHHFHRTEKTTPRPKDVIFVRFPAPRQVASSTSASMTFCKSCCPVHISGKQHSGAFQYVLATFCKVFKQCPVKHRTGIVKLGKVLLRLPMISFTKASAMRKRTCRARSPEASRTLF